MFCTSSGATIGNTHIQANRAESLSYLGGESWFYREFVSSEKKIENALTNAELDEGETRPSGRAIHGITRLVEIVSRTTPLSSAEISVFFGEAVVTWKQGAREVSVLSRGSADDPKLLYYVNGQDQQPNPEVFASATPEDLRKAIRWLYL